jgi:glycosyltransferase involved in cell wall biosynthesis
MNLPPAEARELSLVIPARNEIENLPALLAEVRAMLEHVAGRAEIIVVDDGSTDGSPDWLRREAAKDPRLRPVLLARSVGQSGALAAGFARAAGNVIVTLDAALQNDPADVPRLLKALEDSDVVSGVRGDRHDTWVRKFSSSIANGTRRAVLGDAITDIGCSLKAYRREALEGLPMFATAHRFLPAMCQFRGARIREIAVTHRARVRGQSKYGVANRLGAESPT